MLGRILSLVAALSLAASACASVPARSIKHRSELASSPKTASGKFLPAPQAVSEKNPLASDCRIGEKSLSAPKVASRLPDYPYAQVIEEYTSQGAGAKTLAATFTFADELVSQTRYINGTPTTRFIQTDGFGSTRWLTDASGAITDTIDYDAFGVEVARTGTTSIENLYRGEVFDPNIGFYNLRARWYGPEQGRFLTADTFDGFSTDPRSLHKYAYTHADPINGIDPSGHMNLLETGLVVTVVGKAIDVSFYAYAAYTGGASALASAIVEDLAFMLIPGSGVAKAPLRIARIFERSRKFKLGYPALGATLAHNLRVFGRYGPPGWAAHHIVPGNDARALASRAILDRAGVDINSPINGMFLEATKHQTIHTARYYAVMEQRLRTAEKAAGPDGVRAELMMIYDDIAAGTFP